MNVAKNSSFTKVSLIFCAHTLAHFQTRGTAVDILAKHIVVVVIYLMIEKEGKRDAVSQLHI